MSTPTSSRAVTPSIDRELAGELVQAAADIDAGKGFTLTPEMAAEWAATGTCPGLDAWLDESDI